MDYNRELTLKDVRKFAERIDRPYCKKTHAQIQSILERYFAANEGKSVMGSESERKRLHEELRQTAKTFGEELKLAGPELKKEGNKVRFWGGMTMGLSVAGAAVTIADWLLGAGNFPSALFLPVPC